MQMPTNVVNTAPDFLYGFDKGHPVLFPGSQALKGPTRSELPRFGLDVLVAPPPTGVAAVDTDNLQSVFNSVPPTGGVVWLPSGVWVTNGGIIIPYPTKVYGAGSSDAYAATNLNTGVNGTQPAVYANESEIAATTIVNMSQTTDLFTVSAHGVTMRDFHMSNRATTAPTAGAAVRVGGASGTPANGFTIDNCSTNRCWIGVDIQNGDAYTIKSCKIIGSVKGGIRTTNVENQDEGDPAIIGNWIMSGKNATAPDYGILYNGGGGLKIIGNKISRKGATAAADAVRVKKGIVFQPAANISSSVFTIVGNSIEACDEDNIYIDCTSAPVSNMTITGNEFNCSPSLTNYTLRLINGANTPQLIYFGGNSIRGCTSMIRAALADGLNIGPNSIDGSLLTGALIDIQNGVNVSYRLIDQNIRGRAANTILLNDLTGVNYASSAQRTGTDKRVVREIPAFATTSSVVDLFKIDMTKSGAVTLANIVEVEIAFSGYASGLGAFSFRGRRFIYGAGSNAASIATPAGWTDICFAPNAALTSAAYLTLGSSIAAGVVTLQFTGVPTASTPNLSTSPFAGVFSGEVSMTVDGTLRQLIVC